MPHRMCLFTTFILFMVLQGQPKAQTISGLFTGTLTHDTTKKEQAFELALSEYKNVITGYSYTTFVVNDTFYYSVKRIKARRSADKLLVEEVKMLANNFPEAPSKGVHQIVSIPLPSKQDSLLTINGKWETTKTRQYYSLSGGLEMKRENDSSRSALISHLKELNLLPTQKEIPQVVQPKSVRSGVAQPSVLEKTATYLPVTDRALKVLRTLEVSADSLILSFYDNGIVDGDTISVQLNGKETISNICLTAQAIKKTIFLQAHEDTYHLMLSAKNLGSIPPNTGLLIVQDGTEKHQVHFTADLQTNAAIVFKLKKK